MFALLVVVIGMRGCCWHASLVGWSVGGGDVADVADVDGLMGLAEVFETTLEIWSLLVLRR